MMWAEKPEKTAVFSINRGSILPFLISPPDSGGDKGGVLVRVWYLTVTDIDLLIGA